jgi:hypothetical protein
MLNHICTIRSINNETCQGGIHWLNHEEFWFFDGINRFWGKTDYWQIIRYGVVMGRIGVVV